MASDQSIVIESGQNMTAVCGLMVEEGRFREEDVPGASLNGRKPENLKVPKLKHWLASRGKPTKGKKADLVAQ